MRDQVLEIRPSRGGHRSVGIHERVFVDPVGVTPIARQSLALEVVALATHTFHNESLIPSLAGPLEIVVTTGRCRHNLEIHRQSANNTQESHILIDEDPASVGTTLRSAVLRRPVDCTSRLAVSSPVDSSSEVGRTSGVRATRNNHYQ